MSHLMPLSLCALSEEKDHTDLDLLDFFLEIESQWLPGLLRDLEAYGVSYVPEIVRFDEHLASLDTNGNSVWPTAILALRVETDTGMMAVKMLFRDYEKRREYYKSLYKSYPL